MWLCKFGKTLQRAKNIEKLKPIKIGKVLHMDMLSKGGKGGGQLTRRKMRPNTH